MNNKSSIVTIIVMIIALIIAVLLGANVGSNDRTTPIIFLACIVAGGLIFSMGSNLWMLVPVFWIWTDRISVLPLPLTVRELVLLFAVAAATFSLPLGGFKFKNRFNILDWLVIIMLADVGLVFALNPVGVSALGSDTVGARPYFVIAISFLGYLLVSNQIVSADKARWIPKATLVGAAILSVGKLLCFLAPSLGFILYPIYSGFAPSAQALDPTSVNTAGSTRFTFLLDFSQVLLLFLMASVPPMKIITPLNPVRFILYMTGVIGLFVSGFRSWVIAYGAYFFIAGYFWGKWKEVSKLALIGIVGLLAVIITNEVSPLPVGVQRSLSFLPGNWDKESVEGAESSVDWRIDMWKDTLFTDNVITQKYIGDGFGYSAREMKIFNDMRFTSGGASSEAYQEYFKITGSLHSGPLSSIRYVGYLGFLLFLTSSIIVSISYARTIRRLWGSPFRLFALFVGIPWVFHPLYFLVIFGSFDHALPNLIFGIGLLKMLQNTLRNEELKKAQMHDDQSAVA